MVGVVGRGALAGFSPGAALSAGAAGAASLCADVRIAMTVPEDTSWPFCHRNRLDGAGRGGGNVHGRFLALEREQSIVHRDLRADRDKHLDDGGRFGVAEVRNPNFDLAHSSAFTSPSV